jgi:hypothetical protein
MEAGAVLMLRTKAEDCKTVLNSEVKGVYEVTLIPEKTANIEELAAALKVVEAWREAAVSALRLRGNYADWTEVEYLVRPDHVRVTVKQGMCG